MDLGFCRGQLFDVLSQFLNLAWQVNTQSTFRKTRKSPTPWATFGILSASRSCTAGPRWFAFASRSTFNSLFCSSEWLACVSCFGSVSPVRLSYKSRTVPRVHSTSLSWFNFSSLCISVIEMCVGPQILRWPNCLSDLHPGFDNVVSRKCSI